MSKKLFIAFQIIAGLASIAGWLFCLFSDGTNTIIALCLFCGCLLFLCASLIFAVITFVNKSNPSPRLINAIYARFETTSPQHSKYEFFKTFQNKRLFMNKFEQRLFWTGSKITNCFSPLKHTITEKESQYKQHLITFEFEKPLYFNEVATIYLQADLEDAYNTSEPFLSQAINSPTDLLYVIVTLNDKPESFNKEARVYRCPKENDKFEEDICTVPFDKSTKSYRYVCQPEMEYTYYIKWEK